MAVKQANIDEGVADRSESIEARVAKWMNRTSDESSAARARLYALSPEPRPLPLGKSLEDVIVGQWPGDETDEEMLAFLDDLS